MQIKKKLISIFPLIILLGIIALVLQVHLVGQSSEGKLAANGIGNTQSLLSTYKKWKQSYTQSGEDQNLVLSLRYYKGLSTAFSKARGKAVIDLADGTVSVNVSGLPKQEAYDVWMIDNRPEFGNSLTTEVGNGRIRLGRLEHMGKSAGLKTKIENPELTDFQIGLVVVARAAEGPQEAGLLYGLPSLFQKLYYSEQYGHLALFTDGEKKPDSSILMSNTYQFLVPPPAYATEDATELDCLQYLVNLGERIFFNETFDGNGRTCGTCHPATNNFTIDPEFIEKLPDTDPLFVAEFNPDLAELEKPELMRQFALILENLDGFEDPTNKFVMRSVPHLLALSTSILSDPSNPGEFPVERTGWSGDGAPGTGSLREFAIGAVIQHFPKSLNRIEGTDFRLPTDLELDAMEAFQLSLGRQEELDLSTLDFTSEVAQLGKEIFLNTDPNNPQAGKCQRCHSNAGANSSTSLFNANRDTGVEFLPNQPARLVDPNIPIDGGFGTEPNPSGGFGDGTFNITTVVESADTPPFFHNNSVNTIEESVNFYNSEAFNTSPNGIAVGFVKLETTQVVSVAAFLRIINVLENIRSSNSYDDRVFCLPIPRGRRLLRIAISETIDAIEVLRGGIFLHPDAVILLKNALQLEKHALQAKNILLRNILIAKAIAKKNEARELMVM